MRLFRKKKPATVAPAPVRVLLVCMGNICRSPLAEGVLRQRWLERGLALPVEFDSAGTHGYHDRAPPDPRAQAAALRRGVDISRLRARGVAPGDFAHFDLILAMDHDNHAALLAQSAEEHHPKVRLLMEFAPDGGRRIVPDPYYGGTLGFERVLDLVEEAMAGLLDEVERIAVARSAATTDPEPPAAGETADQNPNGE